jgi:hypothetical protein
MKDGTIKEYIEVWQSNGEYFGYPQCCIDFFIKRGVAILNRDFNNTKLSPEHESLSIKTGFVPCTSCAEKVINKEVKITDLIKDRQSINIFPND